MSERGFDELIHAPVRLRICGMLRRVDEMDFAVLREGLGITDVSLSKHVKALADAGYAVVRKGRSQARADARHVTWVRLTAEGRSAFDAHVAELRSIAAGAES